MEAQVPEPIVIVTVLSLIAGVVALGIALFHTWRIEHHHHRGTILPPPRRDDWR